MGADSPARRLAKRMFRPLMGDRTYKFLQSAAMAWDIRSGNWSEPELDILPYGIREGESVLDVGANYGVYCHHMSRAVGQSGRVYGFEPVPFTFSTLQLIAKLLRFRNVELVPKGCSDKNETVEFELPVQTSGAISAGLSYIAGRNNDRQGRETHARFAATRKVPCQVIRIDDYLAGSEPVSLLKIDIEGAELLALRGAARTIEQHKPTIICEINPWFLEGFGIRMDDLLGFFFDRQYRLYWYDDKQRKLVPRTPAEVVEDNYVFVHPSRANRFTALLASS
jgi:FkbM family methyltransferase